MYGNFLSYFRLWENYFSEHVCVCYEKVLGSTCRGLKFSSILVNDDRTLDAHLPLLFCNICLFSLSRVPFVTLLTCWSVCVRNVESFYRDKIKMDGCKQRKMLWVCSKSMCLSGCALCGTAGASSSCFLE